MARENTTNLGLVKPDKTDQYNVADFNDNMQKIDDFAGLTPPRALTADKLTVGRNINGVLFDGTEDIVIKTGGEDKLNIDHSNDTKPYVTETFTSEDGKSYYEIWSNNFCRQYYTDLTLNNSNTLTFLVGYNNLNYNVVATQTATSSQTLRYFQIIKTSHDVITINNGVSDNPVYDIVVSGYIS